MVELNEKALEQDRARLIHILVVHFDMFRDKAEEAADLFLHDKTLPAPEEVVFCPNCGWNSAMDGKALPAPDDGLIGKLLEAADDWRRLSDPENEELMLAAATALQSNEAAKQQVQKLTDEIDRIKGHAREAVKLLVEGYPQHARFSLIAILEGQEGGE